MAKQERSTGGGGEELSELESTLEELIEIGEDTDQRVEEEATTRQILVDENEEEGYGEHGRNKRPSWRKQQGRKKEEII